MKKLAGALALLGLLVGPTASLADTPVGVSAAGCTPSGRHIWTITEGYLGPKPWPIDVSTNNFSTFTKVRMDSTLTLTEVTKQAKIWIRLSSDHTAQGMASALACPVATPSESPSAPPASTPEATLPGSPVPSLVGIAVSSPSAPPLQLSATATGATAIAASSASGGSADGGPIVVFVIAIAAAAVLGVGLLRRAR